MNPCQGLRGVRIEPRLSKGLWGAPLVDIVLLGIHLVRGGNLWISGVNTGLDGKHGLQLGLSGVIRTSYITPCVEKLINSVLSIYLSYAELYTSSPSFLGSSTIWTELSQTHDGYTQLERARDAAFALIQAICSPEIGRTLI
jgi:hypothetical protein